MGYMAFYPADSRGKLAQVISDDFFPADGCLEKSKKWLREILASAHFRAVILVLSGSDRGEAKD